MATVGVKGLSRRLLTNSSLAVLRTRPNTYLFEFSLNQTNKLILADGVCEVTIVYRYKQYRENRGVHIA